jgi:hypothetical protein
MIHAHHTSECVRTIEHRARTSDNGHRISIETVEIGRVLRAPLLVFLTQPGVQHEHALRVQAADHGLRNTRPQLNHGHAGQLLERFAKCLTACGIERCTVEAGDRDDPLQRIHRGVRRDGHLSQLHRGRLEAHLQQNIILGEIERTLERRVPQHASPQHDSARWQVAKVHVPVAITAPLPLLLSRGVRPHHGNGGADHRLPGAAILHHAMNVSGRDRGALLRQQRARRRNRRERGRRAPGVGYDQRGQRQQGDGRDELDEGARGSAVWLHESEGEEY